MRKPQWLVRRFPNAPDEIDIKAATRAIEKMDALTRSFQLKESDEFLDCDGDLCTMLGPGLRLRVQLSTPTFYEDGWRPGEQACADYVFGIVYSMLYKGEWSLCHWSPKHSEAQLAAEWKRV